MELGRIRFISFDAFNTIIRFKESVSAVYCRFANKEGLTNVTVDKLRISFRRNWTKFWTHSPCYGYTEGVNSSLTSKKWWTDCVKATINESVDEPLPVAKVNNVAENLYEYYQTSDPWALEPSAILTLDYFKNEGIQMGILSNYDCRLHVILRNLSVAHYFDPVFLSGELGVQKPDLKIFRYVENKLQLKSSEIVHIGDDVEKDYFGAKNAGWNALLIHKDKNVETVPSADIILTFKELITKIT